MTGGRSLAGEDIELKGIDLETHETISVKCRFIDTNTAEVIDYHVHSVLFRDGSSYAGLLMIIIFWGFSFYRSKKK
ncbi:MAG: hypothetical protein EHM47_01630 [Ignavibacteriales bacterium]|nr:MAG: hypothetical protein EHM47_01630 [Ignavibacteriales bacterium]